MTQATLPQGSQFYRLASGRDISYSHQLILKLPTKLQDSAWRINSAVKLCFHLLDLALVSGTALRLGILSSLPALGLGLAAGVAIRYIPIRWLNPLKTDDKAWTVVATVIVSLVTGFPIGIVCGAMLYCLVPSRKPPQPESFEKKGEQIIDKLVKAYRNKPHELALHLRDLQKNSSPFVTFMLALEAYLKIVSQHDHISKNELYELLYGENGLMTTYEANNPGEEGTAVTAVTPFLKNCSPRKKDKTVALCNGVRSIEIANSRKGYNYTSLTIVYGHPTSKELTRAFSHNEGQLVCFHSEPYCYGPQSSSSEQMSLQIKNQFENLVLQVEVKSDDEVHLDEVHLDELHPFGQIDCTEEINWNVSKEVLSDIQQYPLQVLVKEYKILGYEA